MFLLSGWQSVMLLQELFGGQAGDGDTHQKHRKGRHDPKGSVDGQQGVERERQQGEEIDGAGQQGVERERQQGEEIDGAMNHHGGCKVVGAPINPGQHGPDQEHQGPGNRVVAQRKDSR